MTKKITFGEVVFSIIEMFSLLWFLKHFISLNWPIFIGSHDNLGEWEMQKKGVNLHFMDYNSRKFLASKNHNFLTLCCWRWSCRGWSTTRCCTRWRCWGQWRWCSSTIWSRSWFSSQWHHISVGQVDLIIFTTGFLNKND